MGMTIETAIRNLSMYDVNECGNAELHTWYKGIEEDMEESFKVAIDTMRRYQMMELDRKSEMMAMLEELKEQLRKLHVDYFETEHFAEAYGLSDSIAIIQLKIDALKGEQA